MTAATVALRVAAFIRSRLAPAYHIQKHFDRRRAARVSHRRQDLSSRLSATKDVRRREETDARPSKESARSVRPTSAGRLAWTGAPAADEGGT